MDFLNNTIFLFKAKQDIFLIKRSSLSMILKNMKRAKNFALLLSFLASSFVAFGEPINWTPPEMVTLSKQRIPSQQVNRDPDLILYIIPYTKDQGVPIRLKSDVGILLVNNGDQKRPKPRYIFGVKKTKEIIDTYDIDFFNSELSKLARGTHVRWHDSCSVSRAYGLDYSFVEKVEKAVQKAGLILDKNRMITCYCMP